MLDLMREMLSNTYRQLLQTFVDDCKHKKETIKSLGPLID